MLGGGTSGELQIRPSNAHRWTECYASPRIEARYPDDDSNALEGTTAHWLADAILKHGGSPYTYVNYEHENGVFITEQMADAVQFYVDYVRSIPGELSGIEEHLSITEVHEDYKGTVDYWAVVGTTLHIVDFKYGWGIVEPTENPQLASYAYGVIEGAKELLPEGTKIDLIKLTIVQPRPYHEQGGIRSWNLTKDPSPSCAFVKYRAIIAKLREAYLLASGPSPESKSGEHCKHCRGLRDCLSARMAAMNAIDYSARGTVENMTLAQKAVELDILTRAEDALKWRKGALDEELTALAKEGKAIPGYGLESGRGSVTWTIPVEEIEELNPDLVVKKPVTPNQALEKGLSEDDVKKYSKKIPGKRALKRDGNKLKQIFAEGAV
jgi:hypothetical protein